jgi:ribosomal protein S18 acetylase RimI-like enzyme
MAEFVTDLSTRSLADACERNLHELFQFLERSAHNDFVRLDGTLRWNSPVRHPWFQGVMSISPPGETGAHSVDESIDYFDSEGVPGFSWWLQPRVRGLGWEQLLAARDFAYEEDTPGMAIDLASLTETPHDGELAISSVVDDTGMEIWARTVAVGFGFGEEAGGLMALTFKGIGPELPVRNYLGVISGEVVASSTLFLGAGVAGVYNVATLESARRRGFGAAMTLAPLQDARELGYAAGILQSSEMGFSVYKGMGFEFVGNLGHYYRKL